VTRGLLLSDVEHTAFNQDSRANLVRKIAYFLTKRPDVSLVLSRIRNRRARATLSVLLEQAFPGQKIHAELHSVEHHLAHLSSAFHICAFEQAAVVSIEWFRRFLERQRDARSRPMAEYISRIRSASSIRRSRSIVVFRIMATNTR
jgi:predicted NodU family carbamoyl transferase